MTFWENFSHLCENVGKKPTPLAKELGISSSTITLWRNGKLPTSNNLLQVADYFGVSADYLLGRTNNETISSSSSINNQSQTFQGTQTNVISAESSPMVDSMTAKFLEIFNNLDFQDQLDTMNFVMERRKKSA